MLALRRRSNIHQDGRLIPTSLPPWPTDRAGRIIIAYPAKAFRSLGHAPLRLLPLFDKSRRCFFNTQVQRTSQVRYTLTT